jgi:DNA-binding CsgD family transcriptional regulator/PAS domain-containing protein
VSLRLSAVEQTKLAELLRTALSPLSYPDTPTWQRTLVRETMALLGADKGGMPLPEKDVFTICLENMEPEVADYPRYVGPLDERLSGFGLAVRLGAHTRAMLWERFGADYFESAYHNDYVVPCRLYDALGITIPLGGRPSVTTVSQLIIHHDRPGRSFGDNGLAVMQLLHPAVHAGIRTLQRLGQFRHTLSEALDLIPHGLAIYDGEGRPIHENQPLGRMLSSDVEGDRLREEVKRIVHLLAAKLRSGSRHLDGDTEPLVRPIITSSATYRVTGGLLDGCLAAGGTALLVSLERLTPEPPTVESLQAQFGLTKAQARVARLMALGKRDREIAEILCTSAHTVRHHAEMVRLRLSVKSRAEVASVVFGTHPMPWGTAQASPLPRQAGLRANDSTTHGTYG